MAKVKILVVDLLLIAGLGLAFACLSVAASGQQPETRRELWPEVDIYIPLRPRFRLLLLTSFTRAEESRDNLEAGVQVSLDYLPSRKVTLRGGYRYAFSLSGSDPFKEHRVILEQTFRHPLPLEVLLSDRNREEVRVVNGETSFRYRNRVTIEREFSLGRFRPTPYGSGELFYDSRFDTWNRNRLTVGLQLPLRKGFPLISLLHPQRQIVLDVYYMRQNDSRSQPAHVNGIGTALNIYF